MVEFAGYEMPLRYSSIRDEHVAVRTRAGLFDLSHMGEVRLLGHGAEATLQRLLASDVSSLSLDRALYTVVCNDGAGIVDDWIVYRVEDGFLAVINAARREADLEWIRAHLRPGTELHDESDETALIAIQGPAAIGIVQTLTASALSSLRPFASALGRVAGVECRISRTGYTGEDGLELYCDADPAPGLWDALLEAGAGAGLLPVGLGARDTLRLEAGLRLYGQDMDEDVDPYSCGLGWTVRLDGRDFVGAARLREMDPDDPPRRFVGLAVGPRQIPRHGMPVRSGDEAVGVVTSGGFSFSLGHGIATAYVAPHLAAAPLGIDLHGETVPARRVPLPFYRRGPHPAEHPHPRHD
jgi:aminomethyltransferase